MDGQNHAPVGVDETLVERADGNPQLALALDFSVKAQGCPNRCKLPANQMPEKETSKSTIMLGMFRSNSLRRSPKHTFFQFEQFLDCHTCPHPQISVGQCFVEAPRCPARSSSREARIRVPFFSAVYFSGGTLPTQKLVKGCTGGPSLNLVDVGRGAKVKSLAVKWLGFNH